LKVKRARGRRGAGFGQDGAKNSPRGGGPDTRHRDEKFAGFELILL